MIPVFLCAVALTIGDAAGLNWRYWPGYKDQVALCDAAGKQVGIWVVKEDKYYPKIADGKWGPACAPPIYPPVEANFGLDKDQLGKASGYWRDGKRVSRKDAIDAIIGDTLPDDRSKLRLTVIGPKDQQEKVLSDLKSNPALQSVRGLVVVQAYAPDHWAVKDVGFVTSGSPTIYLQQHDGKVLFRHDKYEGAEKLAEAIRKADPNYKPDKDNPKPSSPSIIPGVPGTLGSVPTPVWLLGGASLLLLFARRAK